VRTRRVEEMERALGSWSGKRIIVFGDMILDEFVYGVTDRVSREAPVVIVRYDGSGFAAGGAANAALNVASLGGRAIPVGFTGDDQAGCRLREILKDAGMGVRSVKIFKDRPTTNKTRIMAGDYHAQRQQMLRIDREQGSPLSTRQERSLIGVFERELGRADAVILSDYNQGALTPRVVKRAIGLCRSTRIPVIADSRSRLAIFKGVTTATPNEVEAAAAAGIDLDGERIVEKIGRRLLQRMASSSILVTRGRFGMSLFERRRKTRSVSVIGSEEATDVTGAGDTVVSSVALTLTVGGDMEAAMHIANAAASIVVMKRGTAAATAAELGSLLSLMRSGEV
jgi:rfaE bifunctional protein kinase chain/domain